MVIIWWVLFFSLVIAILGLVLAKQMIEPVVDMALEAKLIAEGDLNRQIPIATEDELGDLGHSINQLSFRIRENMDELKSYGEKTKHINTEIHKRVLTLSSLLQIGDNISTTAQMEDIMTLIVEKIVQIMDTGYAMIFLPKADNPEILELNIATDIADDKIRQLEIKYGEGMLGEALASGTGVYADSKSKLTKDVENFKAEYSAQNFAAYPVLSHNKSVGMVLYGNEIKNYKFAEDDLEIIRVFTKQAAIAYENDVLAKKTKELAIKDDLTDLYNEKYMTSRLDEEIKRAILYQRPCSYVVFNVDDFNKFRQANGELATERTLKKIATVMKENVTQIGRAARLSGDSFALLLPEKNKKEAYRIAEEVRKKVEGLDLESEKRHHVTISGGVSENPLDGSTPQEIIEKASVSVSKAKSQGKNRVV
jgi:diguanylate cyclase (GGDEF)-like protein